MTKNMIGSCEPARLLAREGDDAAATNCDGSTTLNADGSVAIESIAEGSDWVLSLARRCGENVAAMAHRVACLRAARGGTSNLSQTAGKCLQHPRTKAVTLANEHRSIVKHLADAEEELAPLLVAAIGKVLEIDLYKADLLRCDEALARKRTEDADQRASGIWPEARAAVALLARLGIREGHWSTLTRATAERIAALILADNASAGVGSPDDPRTAGPRSRRAR